jgi:hypothetical protein
MTTGVALYYPYIHVRDERWLKMALLYWDRIRRIVPHGFKPEHDARYGSTAAVNAGLVESTPPDRYITAAAERFRKTVLPYLEREAHTGARNVADAIGAASRPERRRVYEIHPEGRSRDA